MATYKPIAYVNRSAAVPSYKPIATVNRTAAVPTNRPLIPGVPALGTVPAGPATTQQTFQDWLTSQVDRIVQAQVDAVNAQKQAYLDQLQQQSDLETQRGQALAATLQSLNIPGRVQQIYGDASSNIGGLAQAFSGSLRDQATKDAAAETRMVSGTGQEGAVANNGEGMGNVLYGVQGYIPARSMGETGAAFASEAALEPGFAQRIGALKAADVYDQGLAGLKQFTDQILQIQSQRPQIEQDLTKQYNDAVAASAPDPQAIHLSDGRIQWFDKNTGQALSNPFGPKKKSSSSSNVKTVRLSDGTYQAVVNGKPVGNPFGPPKAASASSVKLQKSTLANGQIQWFDPTTGKKVGPPVGPARAKAGKGKPGTPKQYTYNGVRYTFDANGNIINQVPLKGAAGAAPDKPKYTTAQVAKWTGVAYETAKQAKLGYTDSKGNVVLEPWDGQPGPNKKGPKEVLQDLVGHGIPFRIAVKQVAKFFPVARKWYKPDSELKAASAKTNESAAVVEDAMNAGPRSGATYVFGAAGPNAYDCSGYTMAMVAEHTGVQLPHQARAQFYDPRGVPIQKSQLQPGDVVFFRSSPNGQGDGPPYHCGYYIGNGKYVEYYSSGKPARVSSLGSRSDYMGARRYVGTPS